MTSSPKGFDSAIQASTIHTVGYGTDPEFRRYWLGFTQESRDYLVQQTRTFGELIGSVTESLAGWRILDVGCGDGRWLRRMIEYDAKPEDVVGIDMSDVRFEIGRAKNPRVQLVKSDGISIPFEDNHFDLVTQFVVFSSIPTAALRQQVAHEMCRVMKKGGYAFWWDMIYMSASTAEINCKLHPKEYFDLPIRTLAVGRMAPPGECLRPLLGIRRCLAPIVNGLGYRPTHIAALIGPKL